MPLLVKIIIFALTTFIAKMAIALGIGWGTYTVVLPNLLSFINERIAALPDFAVQTLGILRFDICVTIIVSAYAAKTLSGFFIEKITP